MNQKVVLEVKQPLLPLLSGQYAFAAHRTLLKSSKEPKRLVVSLCALVGNILVLVEFIETTSY
jgi:hypothetical protein